MGMLMYNQNKFLMDGRNYQILSGAIHYFRVVPEYWHDRLVKLKGCGFNTVETYSCWNLHEKKEGEFDFSGILNIEEFILTAKALGLNVILRPGPYICAEWEFGGLPSWLLSYPQMQLRCYDEMFISKVRQYFSELFKHIIPHLSTNGGNVTMIQVENEYGSYGDDERYKQAIVDIYKECGIDCLLFTSDGGNYQMLRGGTIDGILAAVNSGQPQNYRDLMCEIFPNQPFLCAEYWCGNFDHWYEEHHKYDVEQTVKTLDAMLAMGASVNFYMFCGGTNFGWYNGANHSGKYQPTITSYDYDAPLSEAGDLTEKYYAIKGVVEKHFGKLPPVTVGNTLKKAYGRLTLDFAASLIDNLDELSVPQQSSATKTMEQLGQDFGFVLYSTALEGPFEEHKLFIDGLHDRAVVMIDGTVKGIIERDGHCDEIMLKLGKGESARLDILVENMGRINYGPDLRDEKGILSGVRIGNQFHFGWTMYPLTLDNINKIKYSEITKINGPAFYRGILDVDTPADTFVKLEGFKKGVVFVNGFNIGRYWNEVGPQKTLYIPAPLLCSRHNEIVVFDVEGNTSNEIEFLDIHIIN